MAGQDERTAVGRGAMDVRHLYIEKFFQDARGRLGADGRDFRSHEQAVGDKGDKNVGLDAAD